MTSPLCEPKRELWPLASWHTRVTGVVLAVILAGMPTVSLTCALACSHSGAMHGHSEGAASSNHSHHGAMAHPGAATTGTTMNAAYQPACCRDLAALAALVAVARFDGKVSSAIALFVDTSAPTSPQRMSARADRHGAAPPGGSFQIVQRLPLRI